MATHYPRHYRTIDNHAYKRVYKRVLSVIGRLKSWQEAKLSLIRRKEMWIDIRVP